MSGSYNPDYLIFAPTYRCNLYCRHCVIPRERDDLLPIDVGLRVLREAQECGIQELAFTGGEPFLYRFFLFEITRCASELGFTFDAIATNGGWWHTERDLYRTLHRLHECGYRGMFNLSVDDLHQGVSTSRRVLFIEACIKVFQRQTLKITYTSALPGEGLEAMQRLAALLNGELAADASFQHGRIECDLYSIPFAHNPIVPIERAEGLCDISSGRWFQEDFCFGRANVIYVDPQGNVKPCCGYGICAPELTIGNVGHQHLATIIASAQSQPFIRALYEEGLTGIRRRLQTQGIRVLDTPTRSRCFFCHRLLQTERATGFLNPARKETRDSSH